MAHVPREHQLAAEQIRAHLVFLRGGAPFLSPSDALQMVRWFDEGVPVVAVLQALERASDARRKSPSKRRLTLVSAKRHLGRPVKPSFSPVSVPASYSPGDVAGTAAGAHDGLLAADPGAQGMVTGSGHPFACLDDQLEDRTLASTLLSLPPDDELPLNALGALRAHTQQVWDGLGDQGRAQLREKGAQKLASLIGDLDEDTQQALIDEAAMDELRGRWPCCTLATFAHLCAMHRQGSAA